MPPVKGKMLLYSEEKLEEALSDISLGMSIASAAKKHSIPRSTLSYKVNGKAPKERGMGPKTYLTKEEETILVTWIKKMAEAGFPLGKLQLLDSVQKLLTNVPRSDNRNIPFVNNRPGKSWYKNFLKRHPEIRYRTAQNLTASRASVTKENLDLWFREVQEYLIENNYDNILMDPKRVFNGDESAFFLNPKPGKVLAPKGEKSVYQQVNSDEKECLTVLITGNAAGDLAPPMVIFRYEKIPNDISSSIPQEWGVGKSENGWMTSETFFEFLSNIFHPWLLEKKIPLPVILFIDGHSSHLTLHTSSFCSEHGIILVALFPNATHLLQPMDIAVFRTLKDGWKNKIHEWRLKHLDNPILKKTNFCPLLKEVIEQRLSPDKNTLQNGFRKAGLVPWNPEEVKVGNIPLYTEENHQNINSHASVKELKLGLDFIIKYIPQEKLTEFKSSSEWKGNIRDLSLFQFYKNIEHEWKKANNHNIEIRIVNENDRNNIALEEILEEEEHLSRNESIHLEVFENKDEIAGSSNDILHTMMESETKNNDGEQILSNKKSHESKNEIEKEIEKSGISNEMNPLNIQQATNEASPIKATTSLAQPSVFSSPNSKEHVIVPSPFKKILFWPEPKLQKKKYIRREKIPAVATAKQWQIYHQNKEAEKKRKEEEKKARLEERKEKKAQREKLKLEKIQNKSKDIRKTKKRKISSSSSESEEEWMPSDSSADYVSTMSSSLLEEARNVENNFKEGDYVLASFPGKKMEHKYVCVIQEILPENEAEVVGMKRSKEDKFFKLNENDISVIRLSQILKKLNFPTMVASGKRLKYNFDEPLDDVEG